MAKTTPALWQAAGFTAYAADGQKTVTRYAYGGAGNLRNEQRTGVDFDLRDKNSCAKS